MVAYAGPLVLVLLGLCGLVFVFGRRVNRLRSALQELPRPVGDAAGHHVRRRAWVPPLRVLSRGFGQQLFVLFRIGRVVGRTIAKFLRRPPVGLRVPRLAWRSTPRTAPLKRLSSTPLVREDVPGAAPSEPVGEAAVAAPEDQGEPPSPEPVPAVAGPAEIADAPLPVPEQAADGGEAQHPALEAHVDERRPGRRKVVGQVRTARGGARRPRIEERAKAPLPSEPASVERAAALVEAGDLALAEELLVEYLSEHPREAEGYRLLATLYLRRGEAAQAREVCEEALRRDPEATALYGPLGHAYVRLGRYSQALQVFQRAHDADESNLQYLEALLVIAALMDRRPLVRVTAEKILVLQPDHAEAKKHLAKVAA